MTTARWPEWTIKGDRGHSYSFLLLMERPSPSPTPARYYPVKGDLITVLDEFHTQAMRVLQVDRRTGEVWLATPETKGAHPILEKYSAQQLQESALAGDLCVQKNEAARQMMRDMTEVFTSDQTNA